MLIKHAEGRLWTWGRELDLRDADDLKWFQLATMVAGWERGDYAKASLQGQVKYIQRVVRGDVPVQMGRAARFGYCRVEVRGSDGQALLTSSGRILCAMRKDWTKAEAFEALRLALNSERTLAAVAARLNREGVPGPRRSRLFGGPWIGWSIRQLLNQPVYYGQWVPLVALASERWREVIGAGFDPRTQVRHVPELAWFSETEVMGWREKFLGQVGQYRERKHQHLLLGVLACASCSIELGHTVPLVSSGKDYYRCKRYGICKAKFVVGEKKTLQLLCQHAADIQRGTVDVVTAILARVGGGSTRLDERERELRQRKTFLKENYIDRLKTPDEDLLAELDRLNSELAKLSEERRALAIQRGLEERAVQVLRLLDGDLAGGLEYLNEAGKAAVFRTLVANASLAATGRTLAHKVWIDNLELLGGKVVYLDKTPEGTCRRL